MPMLYSLSKKWYSEYLENILINIKVEPNFQSNLSDIFLPM